MAHYSRLSRIVIDVAPADHDRELAFWRAATGAGWRHFERFPEYHGAMLPGGDMGLLLQRLADGRAGCTLMCTPTTSTPRWPGWSGWARNGCGSCTGGG